MRRIHIHVNTSEADFAASRDYYSGLFGQPPGKLRDGYAKWMLEQPRVNFVLEISDLAPGQPGIHHLGIQVDSDQELADLGAAAKATGAPMLEVGETTCCFSRSQKNWVQDPSGVRWELFRSIADAEDYGEKTPAEQANYT
ncbi:MAG: glyoxalase/bleomycin resistance/dioxygenase family protein [Gammaproteobacteria bacterium]|nr:glyoxalase/bleomycin resistance/dioxygenase family protein [Gammaproteobacteria bacterium]NND40221.1 glyoxalase/bleomycin resistance/dioxygenase family protein [Pseudomonadales bacterium]MBT8151903.1 glyoxalase/bleomycin resistance/dioxygenase family protein [Gammaproteobacteria bacterium]NNL11640.1 glyoxalase/bleomycin resistance/dioxygenase family protein [Pseudomonadales bacterium]NNM12473.1 glyoxalase/bleomycin resistance/dioxygenase family protein [Pseudomonadales bacterium]